MTNIWDDVIPEEDLLVYQESGFTGAKVGMGTSPALLIIDVQYRTVGDNKPILQSIRESGYNTSCGERAWAAVHKISEILKVFREKGFPVVYPVVERKDKFDAGRWADKIPGLGSGEIHRVGNKGTEVVAEVAPGERDIVISKRYASAFFGTHLMTQLNLLRADTLIITGCTTSGCVRGTVIDAFSYGFKITVPYDCVYDRSIISHKINLFDMNSKYADVISSEQVVERIKQLPGRLDSAAHAHTVR
jgi:nicotinamidase-related amidase